MGKYSKFLETVDRERMRCGLCQHKFNKQKNSCTTVLNYHFKTKHRKEWNMINGITDKEDATISVQKIVQPTIIESFSRNTPDDAKVSKINRSIMQLIAGAALPLNILENPAWKNFCSIAIPKFQCRGRHQFQRSELQSLYSEYASKLKFELARVENVSLGFDEWSDSSNKHQYLGTIVYFHDKNQLTFRVVGVSDISAQKHTGEFIKKKLDEVLHSFDLNEKVCAVVRDGGSSVKKASELLDISHFDCLAHKLNLAVKDGSENFTSLKNVLNKFRKICNVINKSGNSRREYEEVSAQLGVPPLALKKHIEIRWNAVHAVFERALKVRQTIDYLTVENSDWPKITNTDWSTAETVVSILQPIVDATLLIQKTGMLSSAIIPLCKVLIKELNEMRKFRTFCEPMVKKIEAELAKYEENEFLQFGMMLDVRFKGLFVDDKWKENFLTFLLKGCDEDEDDDFIQETSIVKEDPFSRFMKARVNIPGPIRTKNSQKERIRVELNNWFSEGADMDKNPIEYWAREASREAYPTLHQYHKFYLSAPATTAEAERLFSTARTVLTDNRKLLSADNFSKLLFLQQNLKMLNLFFVE